MTGRDDGRRAVLYVVATPIGNLEDLSPRAARILREVAVVAAEDTRRSATLLRHVGSTATMMVADEHHEQRAAQKIAQHLAAGQSVALVSDAGTPGISDPGFLLVRACVKADIPVECLPGPSALIPAIVVSGLSCDRFHFEGFLPHKKGRQTRLKYLASLENSFVLYESPHRLVKCLDELIVACTATRQACICRELSKRHEEIRRGSLDDLRTYYTENADKVRGEIVIVVDRIPDTKGQANRYSEE